MQENAFKKFNSKCIVLSVLNAEKNLPKAHDFENFKV